MCVCVPSAIRVSIVQRPRARPMAQVRPGVEPRVGESRGNGQRATPRACSSLATSPGRGSLQSQGRASRARTRTDPHTLYYHYVCAAHTHRFRFRHLSLGIVAARSPDASNRMPSAIPMRLRAEVRGARCEGWRVRIGRRSQGLRKGTLHASRLSRHTKRTGPSGPALVGLCAWIWRRRLASLPPWPLAGAGGGRRSSTVLPMPIRYRWWCARWIVSGAPFPAVC